MFFPVENDSLYQYIRVQLSNTSGHFTFAELRVFEKEIITPTIIDNSSNGTSISSEVISSSQNNLLRCNKPPREYKLNF